jgi:hypothetical protein
VCATRGKRRAHPIVLVLAPATSSSASVVDESQRDVTQMQKIAQKAVEKGKAVTVILKAPRDNKKKYTGMLSNISQQGFALNDARSGQQNQFDFDEVQEIRMKGSHVGLFVGLGVAAGAAVVVLVALNSALNRS